MMTVLVTLTLSCGCTEALVGERDGGQLVVCSCDVCRDKWWCECVDPENPHFCEHVNWLQEAMWRHGIG